MDSKAHRRLRQTLTYYSASPSEGHPSDKEHILLLPPPSLSTSTPSWADPLGATFEEARRLLRRGTAVRLVGHGATSAESWPAWARDARGLIVTELGAYRTDSPIKATRSLADDLREWLDEMFAGVLPQDLGGRAFFGSAAARLLQPVFDGITYSDGLAEAHPGATFHCLDPEWLGLPILRAAVESRGGRVFPRPQPKPRLWAARVYAEWVYRLVRAILGQLRHYLRAAPSRARLRQLRGTQRSPELWVALVPDWKRINAHVIDNVALPALAAGRNVGVLLCTTLARGERSDAALLNSTGTKLWPGLGDLLPEVGGLSVEQIVGPEKLTQLAALLATSVRHSWRAARIIARSPTISRGIFRADISRHLAQLSALITTDVLQSIAAAGAVTRLTSRHSLAEVPVVFSSVGLVETQTADLLLQAAGAATVDFVHGSGGENWYGATENSASLRAVWTKADVEIARQLGRPAVIASLKTPLLATRRLVAPRRLLLLSNYVHVDWQRAGFPFEPFQLLLLDALAAVKSAAGEQLSYRWRPHPNDDADAVARALSRAPFLETRRTSTLEEDLEWADVVVSSPSSTTYQALSAGVPVFVHCPPGLRPLPDIKAICETRKFFYPSELEQRLGQCIAQLEAGSFDALAPERRALKRLFPVTPQPLFHCLMADQRRRLWSSEVPDGTRPLVP